MPAPNAHSTGNSVTYFPSSARNRGPLLLSRNEKRYFSRLSGVDGMNCLASG
jgi:hypothetical protein